MTTTTTARLFLGLNAAFSVLIGLELLFFSNAVSNLVFFNPASWVPPLLLGLGFGLILFGLDLVIMATNRFVTKKEVMLIVWMDVGWLIASAALIFFDGYLFTEKGLLVIDIVAIFVAIFALGQYLGARQILPPESLVRISSEGGALIARLRTH